MIAIAIVMAIMGLAGAPGAIIFQAGIKTKRVLFLAFGFIFTALGQSYVVGAYSVFVVSLLRIFSATRPDVPTWPLWIAAFFHSVAAPTYGMKEKPEEPTAQHSTLGIVSLAATIVFIISAFAPSVLVPVYGWIPFFERTKNNYSSGVARDAFVESIICLHISMDLAQPSDPNETLFELTPETEQRIDSLIHRGLTMSQRVTDSFLEDLHPELKSNYKHYLIYGSEIYYQGLQAMKMGKIKEGYEKQIEGISLVNLWHVWWESKRDVLGKKLLIFK
ncbi:hypothetical protein HQ587_07970 [bacterium]|nr:hypothetical protein [bacterium]